MNTRIFRRGLAVIALVLAGMIAAPAAFARSHVSIGLGFYGPGYSFGYNDCVNCYYSRGYYPSYYSGYYYPAPTYYYNPAPTYYYNPAPVYYDPYPAYGTVYYYGGYYHHRWRGHDRGHYRWHHRDHHWHGH